jgi:hypothetical protein
MGTRINFLGWVPYQGLGTPLFLPALRHGNVTAHASTGTGTSEPPDVQGDEEAVRQIRSPFWERGWGCSEGAGRGPEWNANAAGSSQLGDSPTGTASTRDQPCRTRSRRRFRRGFAAGRAVFGDSTALFIPVLEKSPNSRIGKAKGFRRLLVV